MSDKKDIKFSVLLDEKTYERLRKEAYENRLSISRIIRQSLSELFLRSDLKVFFERCKDEKNI